MALFLDGPDLVGRQHLDSLMTSTGKVLEWTDNPSGNHHFIQNSLNKRPNSGTRNQNGLSTRWTSMGKTCPRIELCNGTNLHFSRRWNRRHQQCGRLTLSLREQRAQFSAASIIKLEFALTFISGARVPIIFPTSSTVLVFTVSSLI